MKVPIDRLHAPGRKVLSFANSRPRRNRLRRTPAQSPHRRRGVGNSFKQANLTIAADCAFYNAFGSALLEFSHLS
jgi:hypothetical protein